MKTLPEIDTDKPVFFIDDVDTYYENSDGDVLFWDSNDLPESSLSMECEYRRIRGVFSSPRGPINVDKLAIAIETQGGGMVIQSLDAIQAICHGRRRFTIDVSESGVDVVPQLLDLARQTARVEIKAEKDGGSLSESDTQLKRERRTSELLMQAIMGMLGHSWVDDDECQMALTTEAAMEVLMRQLQTVSEIMKDKRSDLMCNSIHEFVLKFGSPFQYEPLPDRVSKGKSKHCFENSAKLAAFEGWTYVEGFGTIKGVGIVIYHAWVCKPGTNIVIDPTADNIENYFGVPFAHKFLRYHWKNFNSASIIDNWNNDWPLFKMSDAEIRSELLAEAPASTRDK